MAFTVKHTSVNSRWLSRLAVISCFTNMLIILPYVITKMIWTGIVSLACLLLSLLLPFNAFECCREPLSWYNVVLSTLTLAYSTYLVASWNVEQRGGRPIKWLRSLSIWAYLAQYHPVKLVVSDELEQWARDLPDSPSAKGLLPTDRNYLVGYHPHGTLCVGPVYNFLTDKTGFDATFAGVKPYVGTLKGFFQIPLAREIFLALGAFAVTNDGIRYLIDDRLNKAARGNFVLIVPGGASEFLESAPNTYVIVLKRRVGFFRLALQTG